MTLEELIYKRFTESETLVSQLAVYAGKPAVFRPVSPEGNQEGWEGKTQFPQLIYNFDLQANEERKSAGTLSVSLLCQNTTEITPENIEPEVRKCLKDVLLKPEHGTPYAFTWARSDAFEMEETKSRLVIGIEIRFDILEYPSQETLDPDPVMAVNQYIKEVCPACMIMGYDHMEEITEATGEKPVIYCRLASVEKAEETNTVAWMDGRIAIHILCPDSGKRMKRVADIANQISLAGEIILLDHSPMFIKRLQTNYQSDYLKDGQIVITGHFGLLRYRAKNPILRKTNITYRQEVADGKRKQFKEGCRTQSNGETGSGNEDIHRRDTEGKAGFCIHR